MSAQEDTYLAFQEAVDGMPGIIPTCPILNSINGVFTTDGPHGLTDDMCVVIFNHTGTNGAFKVDVVTPTTFEIKEYVRGSPVNSNGTGGSVKAQLVQYENTSFDPVVDFPYEQCYVMFAQPDNVTMGKGFYRLLGYLQMSLHYPRDTGMLGITQRAELYRAIFARGNTLIRNDTVVNISRTASIERGDPPDGYVTRIVKIPFWVDVFE
jgi:hypothetical protein